MAGYSQAPLIRKLGIKAGNRIRFIRPPLEYHEWLGELPDVRMVQRPPYDFVHVFVNRINSLEQWLVKLRDQLDMSGMVWVSWYKKASGKGSEITEDVIRATALPLGFVDVKVCAVSEDWSGLKLVIRVSERVKN